MLLDGLSLSNLLASDIKAELEHIHSVHKKQPRIAVILVGNDNASQIYVQRKHKKAIELGFQSEIIRLDQNTQQDELEHIIQTLNKDEHINGILLQLPLPSHLNEDRAIQKINALKDIDGLTHLNQGKLFANQEFLVPCTPFGVIRLLEHHKIPIANQNVLIIGRSRLVGRPLSIMMLNRSATVNIAHSYTRPEDLHSLIKKANIICVAVGIAGFLKGNMLGENKPVLIDIGINRLDNGKIVGDIDFDSCKDKASAITPVPGGIGPLTVIHLLANTLKAFKLQCNII